MTYIYFVLFYTEHVNILVVADGLPQSNRPNLYLFTDHEKLNATKPSHCKLFYGSA